ncbi:MAG: hypothetical protein WBM83_13455 [Flavobacteriaceae bacterium]
MRKFWAIAVLFCFYSCDFTAKKDKKTIELVNLEMRTIDWNEVDAYPLFETCDESLSKAEQRACFEEEVFSRFSTTLTAFEFVFEKAVDSIVYVDFLVDREGKIEVLQIEKDKTIDAQMPEFDGIVIQCLKGLPELAPALKRGIPVKTRFRIPIVLNAK